MFTDTYIPLIASQKHQAFWQKNMDFFPMALRADWGEITPVQFAILHGGICLDDGRPWTSKNAERPSF